MITIISLNQQKRKRLLMQLQVWRYFHQTSTSLYSSCRLHNTARRSADSTGFCSSPILIVNGFGLALYSLTTNGELM